MFSYLRRQPAGFYRHLWTLSAPIVLQNLITTSLGFMDTFMVGLLGNEEMSAVTLANVPVFILQLLVFGLQSGSSVLISQYWGRQDLKNINRVLGVGFWVAGGISLFTAAVLFFQSHTVMALITNNAALQTLGAPYLRLVGISYVFNSLTSIYVGAHRSIEHPQLGAAVFGVSMLLNTGLNYVLIFGKFGAPALGVTGAAVATLTARVAEFVLTLTCALRSRLLPLDFAAILRPGWTTLRSFIRYSVPVVCNETLWGTGNSMFSVIMGHMANSTEMVAAYTIVGYVDKFSTVFLFGFASAAAVVVGKATGAGEDRDHIYDIGKTLNTISVGSGLLVSLVLMALLPVFLRPVVFPLFKLSERGIYIATIMMLFTAFAFPLRSFDTTNIVGVFRGGGDVRGALLIDVSPLWLAAVPAMALAALVLKLDVVWVCAALYFVESMVKCPIGLWHLRSRRWIRPIAQRAERAC